MIEAQFPHCNSEVLHAPGTCTYCDLYADRQQIRIASNTPFTPAEANGWYGNVAKPYFEDEPCACGTSKTSKGWYCSREEGHEGPCAAWPVSHEAADSICGPSQSYPFYYGPFGRTIDKLIDAWKRRRK
jgi:hypothetical protein